MDHIGRDPCLLPGGVHVALAADPPANLRAISLDDQFGRSLRPAEHDSSIYREGGEWSDFSNTDHEATNPPAEHDADPPPTDDQHPLNKAVGDGRWI
ncbi:MAG: hypothetical protein A4E19_20430 [Nitrospira sp. SG-bin1]|nr:MAG: hypothetical protein A4E19_20430 [Nitrospira sp. SG-bin1]